MMVLCLAADLEHTQLATEPFHGHIATISTLVLFVQEPVERSLSTAVCSPPPRVNSLPTALNKMRFGLGRSFPFVGKQFAQQTKRERIGLDLREDMETIDYYLLSRCLK